MSSSVPHGDLQAEQVYVTGLYARLDDVRAQAAHRLGTALRESGGTPQARSERESSTSLYAEKLAQLNAVEEGLCFGRLDFADAAPRYVGRIGLFAENLDDDPLLVDWRAPAARAFYLATAASPQGATRRRHIRTTARTVTDLDDEVLDLALARPGDREDVTGEAALLAALTAARTGRMRDIVETIQAEQDGVIRADLPGVLVVQGGPGTGKTAVALHRAAYLLYTYRAQLTRHGVLVLGPNDTFLRYISQVLPSLAETGVLLATLGDMFPGVPARHPESPEVAAVKGNLEMVQVLRRAVEDRQWVPDDALEVEVDGYRLTLDRATCEAARDRGRRSGRPHNLGRPFVVSELVYALSTQIAERIGTDPLGGENLLDEADLAEIRRDLSADTEVRAALDQLWPVLTPADVLRDLYESAERLENAGADPALRRADGAAFTPADVPLLDELAELLGEDDSHLEQAANRQRRMEVEYAEGVLEIAAGSKSVDFEDEAEDEQLRATDFVSASLFAERHAVLDRRTAAERAAADRTWAFGHVIVDEAQELSPMAWRLLMRRCPSRSMTVVGDVAQTGDLAGITNWADAFEPYVAQRWRLAELTVNYRTPAEVMVLASRLLAEIAPELTSAPAVREAGVEPWARHVGDLEQAVIEAVRAETDGKVGVLVPESMVQELGPRLTAAVPDTAVGEQPDLLNRVALLSVRQAKGLEFDTVIVVEPHRIVAESPRGLSDLYVAVTRTTQRLGVLHTAPLPAALDLAGATV